MICACSLTRSKIAIAEAAFAASVHWHTYQRRWNGNGNLCGNCRTGGDVRNLCHV